MTVTERLKLAVAGITAAVLGGMIGLVALAALALYLQYLHQGVVCYAARPLPWEVLGQLEPWQRPGRCTTR
jgi:hypothetical protein